MDSAFFSDDIVGNLDAAGVEYTVSVPFERFTDLKARIEARRFWWRGAAQWGYFEAKWKPKAWKTPHRFLFILYLPQALRPCNTGSFGRASNSSTKTLSNSTSSSRSNCSTRYEEGNGWGEGLFDGIEGGHTLTLSGVDDRTDGSE
jgi:hypothetical protein